MRTFQEVKSAANSALTKQDCLFLANLAEDLKTDMLISEKEHSELLLLLQKKIEVL